MARLYNKETNEIMWSFDSYCAVEDAYWELSEFLAVKALDGHDRKDQWYMAVHRKLKELLDAFDDCPNDELSPDVKPIF